MYKRKSPQITLFETPENFMMLSGLNPNNRWVRMPELIPWDKVEEKYMKHFKDTPFSRPAKPARMAIGTLIIKEKYGLSDIETVEIPRTYSTDSAALFLGFRILKPDLVSSILPSSFMVI